MKRFSDIISGSVILLVSAILFYGTTQIRVIASMEGLTSRFFPRIVVGVMAVLGLLILVRGIKAARVSVSAEEDHADSSKGITTGTRCVIETLIAIFVYVFLMEPVGFLITTVLYLFVQMLILAPSPITKKNYLLFAMISLISSIGIYLLFTRVFYLLLPAGILG